MLVFQSPFRAPNRCTDCPARDGDTSVIFGGGAITRYAFRSAVALTLDAVFTSKARQTAGRTIAIFQAGSDPRREDRARREFIAAINLPAESSGGRQRYMKVLQRAAWDFALASIAVVRRFDGSVRMVLGGVAPVPWRVNPSVEEDVASAPLSSDDLETLAERALYDAKPLSGNGYKLTLCKSLLREGMAFLTEVG
jgi:xanthine dehydrogenase YagS FAD-binding subunit